MAGVHFSDITLGAGILPHSDYEHGHGVTFSDVNLDGFFDLFISNAMRDIKLKDRLYINQGNGKFSEQAAQHGTTDPGLTHSIVSGDYDNDGDLDVFFSNMSIYEDHHAGYGRNALYQNNGQGYFVDITDDSGISKERNDTRGAVAFDANNDGWLDIYAVNWGQPCEFYLNRGDGRFRRENRGTEGPQDDESAKQGVTAADFDNDGDIDIYVCRRETENWLLVNGGGGYFSERAADYGVDVGGRSHGAVFVDIDRDADLDLFVINYRSSGASVPYVNVFINNGDGTFTDRTMDYKIPDSGYSAVFGDVDNDADPDMLLVKNQEKDTGARPQLYLNDGDGNLTLARKSGVEVAAQDARGAGFADIDRDGDIDFFIACKDGQSYLLRNDLQNDNHYLDVLCYGPQGDYGGYGSKVSIYEPGHMGDNDHLLGYQESISQYAYLCQNQTALHFGLGSHTTCDVRIVLTDQTVHEFRGVQSDQLFICKNPAHLQYLSGDNQHGWTDRPLAEALAVRITRGDSPAPDLDVSFTALNGGYILESQPVKTDADGIASVHFLLGSNAGDYTVRASSPETGDEQVLFHAEGSVPPVHLIKTGGDHQTGPVGEPLSIPLTVKTVHPDGKAVPDQTVVFTAAPENGTFQSQQTIEITTDSLGQACSIWTLGTQSGAQYVTAALDTETVVFTATAMHHDPHHLVSEFTARPVRAAESCLVPCKIVDQYGNPVPDQIVQYEITSGNGVIQGKTDFMQKTDSSGYTAAVWRMGANHNWANCLKVSSIYNNQQLENSPLLIEIPEILPPSLGQSILFATDSVIADGIDQAEIHLFLKNDSGVPLPDYHPEFIVSGAFNSLCMTDTVTDETGQANAYLSSTKAENKSIRIHIPDHGAVFPDTVTVQFTPPGYTAFSLVKTGGDNQQDTVAHVLQNPLSIKVINSAQMPIPGQPVIFQIEKGNGRIHGDNRVTVYSDSTGLARVFLTLGTLAKTYSDSVSAFLYEENKLGFHESALADRPDSLVRLTTDTLSCPAAGYAPVNLSLRVQDQYGNPIPGKVVHFFAQNGGYFPDDSLCVTDRYGQCECRVITGPKRQYYRFVAAVENIQNYFVVDPETPLYFFERPDTVFIDAMQHTAELKVRLVNFKHDPVPGKTVIFSVLQGDAELLTPSTIQSDSTGAADCSVKLNSPENCTVIQAWCGLDSIQFPLVYKNPTLISDLCLSPLYIKGNRVALTWNRPVRQDISGFTIERAQQSKADFIMLEPWLACPANQQQFTFTDESVQAGATYHYRISALNYKGTMISRAFIEINTPLHLKLHPVYPNPFNSQTCIEFDLPSSLHITMNLYNVNGQLIKTLVHDQMQAGTHHMTFDATDNGGHILPSGLYILVLKTPDAHQQQRILLLK